jgi:hypothetical protein
VASNYTPLRVPIVLLHQKVYPTGHRLEHLVPLEKPKLALPARIWVDAGRVISPSVVAVKNDSDNLFERLPHMRQYFVLLDGKERCECRACNEEVTNAEQRMRHINECGPLIRRTMLELRNDKICVVCQTPVSADEVWRNYYAVPVCSEQCLYVWDGFNPDEFKTVQAIAEHDLEEEELRLKANQARYQVEQKPTVWNAPTHT